jgi:hypothetical protein
MGMEQSKPAIVVSIDDAFNVIFGLISVENFVTKYISHSELRKVMQPEMLHAVRKSIPSMGGISHLIKSFLEKRTHLTVETKSQATIHALEFSRYCIRSNDDAILADLAHAKLLNHLPFFKNVLNRIALDSFPICVDKIKSLKAGSSFSAAEQTCIDQQIAAIAELKFKSWVAKQYKLALNTDSTTRSDPFEQKLSVTKFFSDNSMAKKTQALQANQPENILQHNKMFSYNRSKG